ncbi:unnamed protein product, partial [Rotaria sordida]
MRVKGILATRYQIPYRKIGLVTIRENIEDKYSYIEHTIVRDVVQDIKFITQHTFFLM